MLWRGGQLAAWMRHTELKRVGRRGSSAYGFSKPAFAILCSTSKLRTPVSCAPHQILTTLSAPTTMTQQPRPKVTSREGRLSLAMVSYQNKPCQSIRALARAYNVPESTLQTRLRGVHPRSEIVSVNRKLLTTEEQSLVQWILDLNRRGFPPYIIDVRRMADALLAARG